jgi:predicted phosphoribosyltransferase
MLQRFANRNDAARHLAQAVVGEFGGQRGVVLGLPRGGMPIAAIVARMLGWPLDVFLVRKLGVPGNEELAFGAIASGGVRVTSRDIVAAYRLSDDEVAAVAAREERELARREQRYRHGRPAVNLDIEVVLVVDDGLATGATMRAAITALRRRTRARLVVAVPLAPRETVRALSQVADEVVCVRTPEPFYGVGSWYEDFGQTTDEEVVELLDQAADVPTDRGPVPPGAQQPEA